MLFVDNNSVNRSCENRREATAGTKIGAGENRGSMYTDVGHARDYKYSKNNAKLGGVLLYGDTHPNYNVQSVNRTCGN